MLHCVIFLKTCNPKTSMSPSHHNFFVRHINISSGANHTFGASLTYFLPPFGCRQLPARTLHFNQPLLRTVHYFCYFICGSIRFLLLHLWFHNFHHITWYFLIFRHFNWCYSTPNTSSVVPKKRGASNITVYCSNKKWPRNQYLWFWFLVIFYVFRFYY